MDFRGKIGRNQRFLTVSGSLNESDDLIQGNFVLPEGKHLDRFADDYRLELDDGRSFFVRILRIDSGETDQVYFKSNGPF